LDQPPDPFAAPEKAIAAPSASKPPSTRTFGSIVGVGTGDGVGEGVGGGAVAPTGVGVGVGLAVGVAVGTGVADGGAVGVALTFGEGVGVGVAVWIVTPESGLFVELLLPLVLQAAIPITTSK
jgi:hypothetical protein